MLFAEDTLAPIQLITTRTNGPMGIILVKVSTRQPPINILIWALACDMVRKRAVLPLQEMNNELMMVINKKKTKLVNKDTKTSGNPDSTLGIYITAVKVAQCRQVSENRI